MVVPGPPRLPVDEIQALPPPDASVTFTSISCSARPGRDGERIREIGRGGLYHGRHGIKTGRARLEPKASLPDGLRFLNPQTMAAMFDFPTDMQRVDTEPNRLNNQALVRYFEQEWAHYSP